VLVFAIGGNIVNVTANDGLIEGTGLAAIRGVQAVTVHNNSGTIQANGTDAVSILSLGSVNVTANDGVIGGNGLDGIAIKSNGAASVTNGSGAIAANHGAGRAILAGGDVTVTNGSGTIQANGVDGIGIASTSLFGVATVTNGTGTIRGNAFGIQAKTVTVAANDGTIEASGTNGRAINATEVASVTNGTGTIQANADGGVAISATSTANVDNSGRIKAMGTGGVAIVALAGTATVHNLTGGIITGGGGGIGAATLDVTNAFGATINGGTNGVSGSGIVRNAGTIAGGTRSISFIGTGPNTLILQTGSVLNGTAAGSTGAGAINNLILQGSGTANNDFTNFNSLNMGASDSVWVLNGNSKVGAATISGNLEVGDSGHTSALLTGTVTLNSDGLLAGQGTIIGSVNVNGGVVAPGPLTGTAIGALHAAGDVTFGGNSTFRVNANAAGQASKFEVGGVATLSGGRVQVLAQSGTYAPSTAYTILTATGGLANTTFNGVTTNLAFLTPSLSYTANNVTLTLVTNGGGGGDPGGGDTGGGTGGGGTTGGGTGDGTGGGTTGGGTSSTGFGFAKVALTRNQRAVATALDRGPVSNPLIIAVLNQTVAGARQAFDALSGEVFGSVHNAQSQEAQFARSAMLGRMRQSSYAGIPGDLGALGFGGPALAYAADNANATYPTKAAPGARGPSRDLTFWAQGLGGWGHADSDGNAASLRSRFGGFLSGVDARFGDTWRAGFVAGYIRSDLNVNARSSSAGIDSVQLGAYAAGQFGAFNVRGGGSYSLDSIDTSRAMIFPGFTDKASARFHGNVGQLFGEVGYGMALGSVAVEPLAGLAYVHVRDGSFLESGGVAALSGSSASENTGYSFVGVRAATAMPLANGTVLVPRGTLQWQHAFGDVTPVTALAFQGTGAGFSVAGIPIARDTALVEAGFDWRFAPQAKLGAFYQGELAAHAQTHAVKGAFTWDF
jgi:outer membrane autotransporter protein